MFCNNCGAKNPDNAKFCNNCGAKLTPVDRSESPEFYSTVDKLPHFNEKAAPIPQMPVAPSDKIEVAKSEPIKAVTPEPMPEPTVATHVAESTDPMQRLSTFRAQTETKTTKRAAAANLNPIEDEYWNDTVEEIDAEINAIPKEIILKVAGSIVALFAIIAYLIYVIA